jgi:acetyl-CoA carboxylase carboxyltransferase component
MAPSVLDTLVPDDGDTPFALVELAAGLVDAGSLFPLRSNYARELLTALARLDGVPIGVIANSSEHKGGILTVEAADKAARFITLCDAYGLPLLFLVDVPGFAIGRAAERAGIERAAGRLFAAIASSAVPRLTLVVRKAHTAGLYAMCGPSFDPDAFLALPTASIALFGERIVPLERELDADGRASLRGYLRTMRTLPDAFVDQVVMPSAARAELVTRLRNLLDPGRLRPRTRRFIPA